MHLKFHQNRSKFGCIIARFSKMPRHGISIFAIFNHLRVIFEWGNMLFSLSFFLPYLHLRLTVLCSKFDVQPFKAKNKVFEFVHHFVQVCSMFKKWCLSLFHVRLNGVWPFTSDSRGKAKSFITKYLIQALSYITFLSISLH